MRPLAFVYIAVYFGLQCLASDTGHHFDLTRSALRESGFSATAVQVAQFENWLTDYYSSSPTSPDSIRTAVEKLHFDNLYSKDQVIAYWAHFANNTKLATEVATQQDDPVLMLSVIGVSMHAVQDFYTHSNWVENHPRNGFYRTETWFSDPSPPDEIYTGKYPPFPSQPPPNIPEHGGYDSGLNKDSYVRPKWDDAYVFSYCASLEWLKSIEQWSKSVDAQFWGKVQSYSVAADVQKQLNNDLHAAFKISLWIKNGDDDGHWKGNGSGDTDMFVVFAPTWVASPDSLFVKQFKEKLVHEILTKNLYSSVPAPALPSITSVPLDRRAVIVRILHVAEKGDTDLFEPNIDVLGKADFYSKVSIDGFEYVDAVQQDDKDISPKWTTIHFVLKTQSESQIDIAVWDEDGALSSDDDHCDLHPTAGKKDLSLHLDLVSKSISGDANGVHADESSALEFVGKKPDKDRASIRFFIDVRDVGP